jgi:uncharacterized protein YecE (DUF72 family)
LPEPNKAAFPEAFRDQPRLAYYASLFNSLEINRSFYKVPMPATFEKWAATVPEDFRFTVKLGRHITHEKGFVFRPVDIDTFMAAANRLGAKKGCLLIQLPPGLRWSDQNADQLKVLLQRIRQSVPEHFGPGLPWKLAVEFRHPSWYVSTVNGMLDSFHASLVLQDMPASAVSVPNKGAPFIYIRFHGPAGDYKGGYAEDCLQAWAKRINAWRADGKEVYVYFNNTIGDAVANGRSLMGFTLSPLL